MILCITPNPAIDRTIILPSLVLGNVHRAQKTIVAAGGKGLNVARTIRRLGGEVLCMGFAGGHTGHLLADLAKNEGLRSSWTWTSGETRTCTILVSQKGDATLINEPGMHVSREDWQQLEQDINKQIPSAGLVCISGSFPPDTSAENLQRLLSMLVDVADTGKQVWVDTSGSALLKVLALRNVCVKVNGNEIGEVLGLEVRDLDAAKRALKMLGEQGLRACVITLGVEGALLVTKEGRWHAYGPRVRVVSTVGSGDAFLGGLVSALDGGKNWPEALREAVAVGTANTLSIGGGEFVLQEFKAIREQIQIEVW
jgi:1-phosphofructokinase family hexose kinase